MIAEKMKEMVANSSAIRAMFEEETVWLRFTGRRMSMISASEIRIFRLRRH